MRNSSALLFRDNPTPLEHRDALPRPNTFDAEALTIEAVIASDTPVKRRDQRGEYLEILDPAGLDLASTRGASVLDSHAQGSGVEAIIGSIDECWIEGSEVIARIRFSSRPEVAPIVADVRSGIIKFLSVGYSVSEWIDGKNAKGERTRVAAKWAAREASFVSVGADPTCKTRTGRADINPKIRELARHAGVSLAVANDLIDRGATLEESRMRMFDEMVTRSAVPIRSGGRSHNADTLDNPEVFQRAASEALLTRINPSFQPSPMARQFVGMSTIDLARECLQRAGQSITGLSGQTLITRALQSTSDYPAIFANTFNKSLRDAYTMAPGGIRQIARETTANDFRAKSRIQFDSTGFVLELVPETGEFKHGAFIDSAESYAIDTYGKIFSISRQALINDDLGALSDVTRRLGMAAAEFERQFLVNLLTANAGLGPVMSDGEKLFDVAHNNEAGTGAVPSEATLSDARLAMRRQTGPGGGLIAVTPKFLLVPPELETLAEKLVTSIQPVIVDDVNSFAFLSLIVEPRLTDPTRWYLVADPTQIDGIEFAYLAGAPGPQTESKAGFEVDGISFKIRLDFGGGVVEHRGLYMNAGE